MTFYAYEWLCADEAGLILAGVDEGKPEWIGKSEHWRRYNQLVQWFEQTGVLAWSQPKF